ncbi:MULTISPECIES: hypothetical protein [Paenibacillus]|uniref:Uncharacterized protein n=1 Tax=Paenibacillus arenosi TaxID=2774142 RepID=A0ABR9ARM0_9BACL|nr:MULTISPECIES: hypothetical protein [Paenibacillus]MBD8496741.1 hypothetical protein [Paenibacillus arenosi]
MKLHDALFNWLQMVIVVRHRPDDGAAKQTLDFFAQILHEDHMLTSVADQVNENTYTVTYEREGQINQAEFDRNLCEQLWHDIESNPKYNE